MNDLPQPRVHAGITTRNRAHVLPKALDSLRATRWPSLTVTVLDDASTDGTPALRVRYPEIGWVRHDQPAGIIASRNELMRAAGTEFFLCLDDDAWFLAGDELALALARLQANPALAGIAFDILSPDRPDPCAAHRTSSPSRCISAAAMCSGFPRSKRPATTRPRPAPTAPRKKTSASVSPTSASSRATAGRSRVARQGLGRP